MSLVLCEHRFEFFCSRFYSRFQVQLNRTPSHSFKKKC